jgi:hypothetical protein
MSHIDVVMNTNQHKTYNAYRFKFNLRGQTEQTHATVIADGIASAFDQFWSEWTSYDITNLEMKEQPKSTMQIKISTQIREWYGNEDHIGDDNHGRYKCKGGKDFITEVEKDTFWYKDEVIRKAFNEQYNRDGLFFKYEAQEISPYYEPEHIELVVPIVEDDFDPYAPTPEEESNRRLAEG